MLDTESIPSQPGTYVLILFLPEKRTLQIGRLGERYFPIGYYAYIGSARGSGGLAGRVGRHLRPSHEKRPHWHIDALCDHARITQIWWQASSSNQECRWAERLSQTQSCLYPGFGSSDCRCPGHLLWLKEAQTPDFAWSNLMELLGSEIGSVLIPVKTVD